MSLARGKDVNLHITITEIKCSCQNETSVCIRNDEKWMDKAKRERETKQQSTNYELTW